MEPLCYLFDSRDVHGHVLDCLGGDHLSHEDISTMDFNVLLVNPICYQVCSSWDVNLLTVFVFLQFHHLYCSFEHTLHDLPNTHVLL